MTERITLAGKESIATRHTRLFGRTNKRSWADDVGRLAAGLVVVASIFASLYFLAS
jgi:hypothetical protein